MCTTCQISWIDDQGMPTPDSNPMVGYCYREAYHSAPDWISPNGHSYPRTENFRICAAHKLKLDNLPHWHFIPCDPAVMLQWNQSG